jgi:hypothetical protein
MPNNSANYSANFNIVFYVSESLLSQVKSSLDIFINTPIEHDKDTVYGSWRQLSVLAITRDFLKDRLSPAIHIPLLRSELSFIICEHTAVDIEVADLIRNYRIKKKAGMTFIDVIKLEDAKTNNVTEISDKPSFLQSIEGINYNIPEFKTYFSEGIRFWHPGYYESLINTVKSSLYVLGFYFPTPIICIDWTDFLYAMKSKGFGTIFLQGNDFPELVSNCFKAIKSVEVNRISMMYGDVTLKANGHESYCNAVYKEATYHEEVQVKEIECIVNSLCVDLCVEDFLPSINPDLSWCWFGFSCELPDGVTPSDITLSQLL